VTEAAPRRDTPAAKEAIPSEDASTTKSSAAEVPSAAVADSASSAPAVVAAAPPKEVVVSSPTAEIPAIPETQHGRSSEALDAPVVVAQ